jgi:hypothetical protein
MHYTAVMYGLKTVPFRQSELFPSLFSRAAQDQVFSLVSAQKIRDCRNHDLLLLKRELGEYRER